MKERSRLEQPEFREHEPTEDVAVIELRGQRAEQQDSHAWAEYERPGDGKRLVLAIADGHGWKGEKASKYAVERITHQLGVQDPLDAPAITEEFLGLHSAIVHEAPEAGTTLTAVVREGNKLTTAHVGNSEAWLFKNGELKRRTVPHTYDQHQGERERLERSPAHMIDGAMTVYQRQPNEPEVSAKRLHLTRDLGDQAFEPFLLHEPQVETIKLDGGEKYLLVGSKGFWNAATLGAKSLHALEHILETATSAEEARGKILSILERRALNDNATVLIAKL